MLLPYVYRSGVIVFRNHMPDRSLPITRMQHPKLRATVDVLARHGRPEFGQSRKLMIMPGVPEARTDQEAYRALIRFKREVERRLQPHNKRGRRHV